MVTDIKKSALWATVILLAAGLATATMGWMVVATDVDPWKSPVITALKYFWSTHAFLLDATGLSALPVETPLQAAIWIGTVATVWLLAWTIVCQLARIGYRKVFKQTITHSEVNG